VLRYIANESKRFRTFVANRIAVIRDASDVQQWRYVNISLNVADYVTRGLSIDEFLSKGQWTKGPEFLSLPESEWPSVFSLSDANTVYDDLEIIPSCTVNAVIIESNDATSRFLTAYSSWDKLKKMVAWIMIIRNGLKEMAEKRKQSNTDSYTAANTPTAKTRKSKTCNGPLQQQQGGGELQRQKKVNTMITDAERAIIRYVQSQHFSEIILAINQNEQS
jgi:hypothetical protein